jgi:hypothetical protein
MKPHVFMSKRNAELCVGLPLMIERDFEAPQIESPLASIDYRVTSQEQIGWAMFYGDECFALWTLEQVDSLPLESLGDL